MKKKENNNKKNKDKMNGIKRKKKELEKKCKISNISMISNNSPLTVYINSNIEKFKKALKK